MFEIPEQAIEKVAEEIRRRTSRDHKIPVLGTADNVETPQIFEILPFDQNDGVGADGGALAVPRGGLGR